MFFSDSPKIVIYLKSNSIQLYRVGMEGSETLTFPKDATSDQEVKDRAKIEEAVLDFLLHLPLKKQKVLFVLSDDVILHKSFPKEDANITEEVKKYLENLPFNEKKTTYLKMEEKESMQIIATNKDFYESVGDVFEKLGWEIRSLVPAFLFGIIGSSALTPDEVNLVVKDYKKVAAGDFIYQEVNNLNSSLSKNSQTPRSSTNGRSFSGLTLILIIILVMVMAGAGFFAMRFLGIELPKSAPEAIPEPKVEIVTPVEEEASPSAGVISSAVREALSIKILNGSGIRGQAATIQEELEGLGYKNIKVGNADEEADVTAVVFSNNVSASIQEEIINQLKQMFQEVTSKQSKEAGTIDIDIMTGKNVIQ